MAAKNLTEADIAKTLRELAVLVEGGAHHLDPETLKQLAKEVKRARFSAAIDEAIEDHSEILTALSK